MRRWGIAILSIAVTALASAAAAESAHDALIAKHAAANSVPESLVRRVIWIESRGNPRVVSKGNYGLMQIRLGTARAMGYSGTAQGLLDADTNMTYAVKYLAGAYRAAGCNAARAIAYYQRGYHGAKRARCAAPVPSRTELAGVAPRPKPPAEQSATADAAAATAPSANVLMPKPVRTVAFSRSGAEPLRSVASLNPEAVPLPPVRNGRSALVSAPAPDSKPDPMTTQTVAMLDPVPLPLKRPEVEPPSEPKLQQARRPAHKRARRSAGSPVDLLAFVKNLIAPERKSRTRRHRAHAQR